MNLYELTEDMRRIVSDIEAGEGELTEEIENALTLNADNAIEKLEGYGKVLAGFKADAEGFKAEEKRLADKRRVVENVIAKLKTRAFEYMEAAGTKKVVAGTFTFAVQKSSPSLDVADEGIVPYEYFLEQAPTLDRKTILAELKTGSCVPGCSIKQGSHLRIR